jgi:hypothetical protein
MKRLEQVLSRSRWGERGKVAQTIYTHVIKCKNNKIKKEKYEDGEGSKASPLSITSAKKKH